MAGETGIVSKGSGRRRVQIDRRKKNDLDSLDSRLRSAPALRKGLEQRGGAPPSGGVRLQRACLYATRRPDASIPAFFRQSAGHYPAHRQRGFRHHWGWGGGGDHHRNSFIERNAELHSDRERRARRR